MKRLEYWMGGVCAAVLAVTAMGCSETASDVPSGADVAEIRIEASAERVSVGEEVTFAVFEDDVPITGAVVRRCDTGEELGGPFVADDPGCYRFVAEFDGRVSDETVVAADAPFEPAGAFYRRVLVQKFTGTWCIYCPQMTEALDRLDGEYPERMVHMSVHVSDGFTVPDGSELAYVFGIASIPQALFDCRTKESYLLASLRSALETELESYPARCGVAVESERTADGKINVEARVRCTADGDYRVCCAVVEDSLYREGGTSADGYYHRVLRKFVGPSSYRGTAIGGCEEGWEYPCAFSGSIGSAWRTERCRVVVYVLAETGQGTYVTNVVECPLEGSCGFEYEEETTGV